MAELMMGIDYGAKNSGLTRVVSGTNAHDLQIFRIKKGKDTDLWLRGLIEEQHPHLIAIDAPLSLPGVYQKLSGYGDYFYRICDRELKAMSPMFLGGLTARAMKLKQSLQEFTFIESYPAAFVRAHYPGHEANYKTNYRDFLHENSETLAIEESRIHSQHDLDALLCWHVAQRHMRGLTQQFGEKEEGEIHV